MNRFNIYIIAGLFFVFGITIGVNTNYIFNYLGLNSDNLKKYNSLVNYVKNRYYADINIDSLIEESDVILRELSWNHIQGREYLQKEFNVLTRKELNEEQLISFVDKLKSIRNHYPPQ